MRTSRKLLQLFKIFAIATLFVFSSCLESAQLTKQQQWEELSQKVDTWTDRLGKPIDPGIKEVVIALNLLGIPTRQSCEGHLDWGLPYPWVDFEIDAVEIRNRYLEIYEQAQKEESSLKEKHPHLSLDELDDLPEMKFINALHMERFKLSEELEKQEQELLKPLYSYLEQFYQSRPHPYDLMLVVIRNRLQSIGGERQAIRSDSEKMDMLMKYRQEMKDFAVFLKNKFFNETP